MAKAIEEQPKTVVKKPANWALLLSVLSLSISAINFYFANFRVAHSFKVILAPMTSQYLNDTMRIHFKGIFQNYGNKPEAILRSFAYFNSSEQDSMGYKHIDTSFIVKPGEIVMKDYHLTFSPNIYQRLTFQEKEFTTKMTFIFLDKDGYAAPQTVDFATFRLLSNKSFVMINSRETWHNKVLISD